MHLIYSDDAADKLDFYEANDSQAYEAFDEILELLENHPTDERLRRHLIRPANAFAVRVFPGGRGPEPAHYLFWIPEPDDVAFIKWLGNTNASF
jgi:hypothetical protein